jgi:TonB family protein
MSSVRYKEGCVFSYRYHFLLLLVGHSLAFAQQPPVYEVFEVDTVAQVQGGSVALDNFVEANMRVPVAASARGLTGRVILTGVVEPDGHITDVAILKGFRTDCDQEAMRVFSSFRAWRPARKSGKAVRQKVSYPLLFKSGKPFAYVNGTQITYSDYNGFPLRDSLSKAYHKYVNPIGNDWIPTGDFVQYKRRGSGWVESKRYPLTRSEIKRSQTVGKRLFRVGRLRSDESGWYDTQFDVDEDGVIVAVNHWGKKGPYNAFTFYPDGMLHEWIMQIPMLTDRGLIPSFSQTDWYANGQIHHRKTTMLESNIERMYDLWDSTGVPIIQKGEGYVSFMAQVPSYADSTRLTQFTEQGMYERSYKQKIWTGHYEDGSYGYEELYKEGVCQWGKAWRTGSDTLHYTTAEQQPEFIGGEAKQARFLRENLRYPASVRLANIQGDTVIGFTVCTDGTLCDYTVLESVDPALDQEALRLVRSMSGKWKPAIRHGQAIKSQFKLPVSFRLN